MKHGEFKGQILGITVSPSSDQPAIFTRIEITDGMTKFNTTHNIRFCKKNGEANPAAIKIGFDEFRGAFPIELANLKDEALLTYLMEKTDTLLNRPVEVRIEPQITGGITKKNDKGEAYYNVRLRSAVKNLNHGIAATLAQKMLNRSVTANQVNTAFKDAASEKPTSKGLRVA